MVQRHVHYFPAVAEKRDFYAGGQEVGIQVWVKGDMPNF
jgi:hypothetical protein